MPRLNDIYYRVDREIVENGFWEADNEGKKTLIDTALKHFVIEKIEECNQEKRLSTGVQTEITLWDFEKKRLYEAYKDVSLSETVRMLGDIIPKEDHFETLRHLTHYILNVAGTLQGPSIVWSVDNSVEFLGNSVVTFNDRGYWDALISHDQTSYVQTFEFAHSVFNEYILGKGPKQKQLVSSKKLLPKSDN